MEQNPFSSLLHKPHPVHHIAACTTAVRSPPVSLLPPTSWDQGPASSQGKRQLPELWATEYRLNTTSSDLWECDLQIWHLWNPVARWLVLLSWRAGWGQFCLKPVNSGNELLNWKKKPRMFCENFNSMGRDWPHSCCIPSVRFDFLAASSPGPNPTSNELAR